MRGTLPQGSPLGMAPVPWGRQLKRSSTASKPFVLFKDLLWHHAIVYQGAEFGGVAGDVHSAPVRALLHGSVVLCCYPFLSSLPKLFIKTGMAGELLGQVL